jgi:predicted ATPase
VAIEDLSLLLGDPDRFLFDSIEKQKGRLNVKQDKLYGREKEAALITHAFHRVSLSGESEALLVDGFSGCGKSKLIQSVVGNVNIAGGYVIHGKFDEIVQTSSQIGVLTYALNQLCILICEKNEPTVVNDIVIELMMVFGTHMYTLARVLPNITMLSNQLDLSDEQNTALNLSSVSYILLIFLRVVSSKSRPVMVSRRCMY